MGTLGRHWKLSELTRQRMRKPKSAEHAAKIRAARKGKAQRKPGFKHSEETLRKMSQIKRGKRHTEASRAKMSAARKGSAGYWTGIKRSAGHNLRNGERASRRAISANQLTIRKDDFIITVFPFDHHGSHCSRRRLMIAASNGNTRRTNSTLVRRPTVLTFTCQSRNVFGK